MNLESLKEPLGERFAEVESYINSLIEQRDAAKQESIQGRRSLKAKAETAESNMMRLMEKLGIETLEEIDALPAAKGQAEALKQLETRLKAKDAALAEKDAELATLKTAHRATLRDTALDKVLAAYDFVDRDLVASYVQQHLDWQDEQLIFKSDKGDKPLDEGVRLLVEAKPTIVKLNGARGSGYNPNARGGEVKNPWAKGSFNLTEQLRLAEENPTLAAQLKTHASGT